MSGRIGINSNLAALNIQRRLGQSTSSLEESFTRLSSGLRINKARDDAAGLAIAESLNVDAHVFAQGIRNINDAIGLLNIAEGAARELSSIVIRQLELASQASNGTLGASQRQALNEEANALVEEYNRIIESTEFNDLKLIDRSLTVLRVQGGYGNVGSITVGIGQELGRTVGDGTFQSPVKYEANDAQVMDLGIGDFNNDGEIDVATTNYGTGKASVFLGNGDGSFNNPSEYSGGAAGYPANIEVGDFDGDGNDDLVIGEEGDSTLSVLLGNGDGSFRSRTSYDITEHRGTTVADVDNDGVLDLIAASNTRYEILMGNGNGSFKAAVAYVGGDEDPRAVDLNGDGKLDLVAADREGDRITVVLGNGDGTFKAYNAYDVGNAPWALAAGDINGDGVHDVVTGNYNDSFISILNGNGDGSFQAVSSVPSELYAQSVQLKDVNGDEVLDLLAVYENEDIVSVFINNGDGTFQASTSFAVGPGASQYLELEDLNNDNALDVVTAVGSGTGAISIALGNTRLVSSQGELDLLTQSGALQELGQLSTALDSISQELGVIGAFQSRLTTAVENLQQSRENYMSARSQIVDTDIAEESALLVKNQILQQAGAAILAQANQAPALALELLA